MTNRFSRWGAITALLALAAFTTTPLRAQDLKVYRGTQVPPEVERIYERGLQFLVKSQTTEGTFPGNYGQEPATAGGSEPVGCRQHGKQPQGRQPDRPAEALAENTVMRS